MIIPILFTLNVVMETCTPQQTALASGEPDSDVCVDVARIIIRLEYEKQLVAVRGKLKHLEAK